MSGLFPDRWGFEKINFHLYALISWPIRKNKMPVKNMLYEEIFKPSPH